VAVLGGEAAPEAGADERLLYSDLRRELIRTERDAVLELRNDGRVSQDVQRLIEHDLDLDEARLR
jgi:CPA1 family monovalent cation:H+ antiporter